MAIKLLLVLLFVFAFTPAQSTVLWHQWKFSPQNYPPVNWSPPAVTQFTRNVYTGPNNFDSLMHQRYNQYMWKSVHDPNLKVYCGIESYLNAQGTLCHRNPRYWTLPNIPMTCVPTYNMIPCSFSNCCYSSLINENYAQFYETTSYALDMAALNLTTWLW